MVNKASELYKITIKLSQNHSFISTCYHEAGHAVCGLLMFIKIAYVSALKGRRADGETYYEMMDTEQSDSLDFQKFLIMSDIFLGYAGLIAEKIFYQDITGSKIFPNVLKDGIEEDLKEVNKLIVSNDLAPAGRKRYLFKKRVMKEIKNLLLQHWDVVKIVAHALFEKGKVSYDELRKIICRKSINKKFWKKQFSYINKFVNKNKPLDAKDLKIILPAIGI